MMYLFNVVLDLALLILIIFDKWTFVYKILPFWLVIVVINIVRLIKVIIKERKKK